MFWSSGLKFGMSYTVKTCLYLACIYNLLGKKKKKKRKSFHVFSH